MLLLQPSLSRNQVYTNHSKFASTVRPWGEVAMLEDGQEKWPNSTLKKFKGWLAVLCRKGIWWRGWLSQQGAQAARAAATHWSALTLVGPAGHSPSLTMLGDHTHNILSIWGLCSSRDAVVWGRQNRATKVWWSTEDTKVWEDSVSSALRTDTCWRCFTPELRERQLKQKTSARCKEHLFQLWSCSNSKETIQKGWGVSILREHRTIKVGRHLEDDLVQPSYWTQDTILSNLTTWNLLWLGGWWSLPT